MMRKIINVGYADMRHRIMALLSTITCLLSLLLLAPSALADYYYLKPGQSKTISAPAGLDTVFVSNPTIADYKIIGGDSKIVVYAREVGYSDITLYDGKSNVLKKISIEVDVLLADILTHIKALYPESKVKINKITGTDVEKGSIYVLSGTAPTEEAMNQIYRMVGQAAASDFIEYKFSTEGGSSGEGGGDSASRTELPFMSYRTYANVINRLTLPQTNQVNVQLTVVEVSKDFKDNLGIEWSNSILNSAFANGTFGLIGFKGLNRNNIHNVINALQTDSVARVLAQPNLTVLSGEVANFLVGGQIPITIRGTENAGVYSTEYKDYGIMLSIAAKVDTSKKIKLFISNEISNIEGTYGKDDFSMPVFKRRTASSTIELADGDSFAIAGLLNESDVEKLSKIPFIGDIPILGALARNTSLERAKTELMIFATVNLVKPTSSSANIELPSFKKTNVNKLFFNVGVDKATRENRLNNNTQLSHDSEVFLNRGGFAK